jgi:hypothetical protein
METERFIYWSRSFCAILKQCRAGFYFVLYMKWENKNARMTHVVVDVERRTRAVRFRDNEDDTDLRMALAVPTSRIRD